MSITTDMTSKHLQRSQLWSGEVKEQLLDKLMVEGYMRWIPFPEGDNLNIPSIGEASIRDYSEDTDVRYDSLDTGNFTFAVTEYKQSGLYITRKARQDSFYAAQLEGSFVPKMARALGEQIETDILGLAQIGGGIGGAGQAAGANLINGAAHRWVAQGGTGAAATQLNVQDFAKVVYSAKRANVPQTGLVGIVDPSVEYMLNTLTNIVGVDSNPRFEGIIESGFGQDMKFLRNVYGIDLYSSNYLPTCGSAGDGTLENITAWGAARASAAGAKVNVFFSTGGTPDVLPFVGAWRQMPIVDGEWNKDKQREEYVTTSRYGMKLYRPENLISIVSDNTI